MKPRWILVATCLIIILTIVAGALFADGYSKINSLSVHAKWDNRDTIKLANSPAWFYYSNSSKNLFANRVISDSNKVQLLSLANSKHKGYSEYKDAINELSYASNELKSQFFIYLLYIAGCSAVIGVQIRTIYDFIRHVCYKKNLELDIWWPWYVLRPLLGFIVGGLIIVLSKAQLFTASIVDENISSIAIAAVAGFGVVDAVGKLRLIAKTLFGEKESGS